jgi:hypothetical protein
MDPLRLIRDHVVDGRITRYVTNASRARRTIRVNLDQGAWYDT